MIWYLEELWNLTPNLRKGKNRRMLIDKQYYCLPVNFSIVNSSAIFREKSYIKTNTTTTIITIIINTSIPSFYIDYFTVYSQRSKLRISVLMLIDKLPMPLYRTDSLFNQNLSEIINIFNLKISKRTSVN